MTMSFTCIRIHTELKDGSLMLNSLIWRLDGVFQT